LRYCDFTDLPSVAPALAGGERIYFMPMNHPPGMVDEAAVKSAVVKEAKAAGIRFCVYQSFIAAAAGDPTDDDLVTENALKASGIAWTILRTGVFAESLGRECKRYIREGRIPCHQPEAPRAYVTRDDIAAAGAEVLVGAGHAGKTYNVIGNAMNMEELAALLSDIADKPIVTAPATGRAFGGNINPPPSDLATLIGRPPISVADQFRADRQELLTGVPVGAEVKFGFQWQARGMETRPDDLGLTMLRLFAAARGGDSEARARFRAALAENPARLDQWRRTHPEWFGWEETSGVK